MAAPKKPRPAVDDEVKAKFRAALDAKKSHGGADVSDCLLYTSDAADEKDQPCQARRSRAPRSPTT